MQIKKAVITAGGRGVRLYPAADTVQKAMLPIIDRDGLAKPAIQIIAEEALASGVETICIVCAPGDESQYRHQLKSLRDNLAVAYTGTDWAAQQVAQLDDLGKRLEFVAQEEPLGYGHAVYCARSFVGEEPFLLLLGDHLYSSHVPGRRCAEQVVRLAVEEGCAVAAVQATREHLIGRYGTLSGKRVAEKPGVYQIERILEKPSLSLAEQELLTQGLRAGYYLCFFGMHVLPHRVFDLLEPAIRAGADANGGIQLTPALDELASREKYLALEVQGRRYDTGARFGLLQAQVALALAGRDRDEVLATLMELLAEACKQGGAGADA
ncbi:MAG TPA: sugar phosphate nucleotidyltransferase [Candidatus Hydrogenedentes bacterium]|nr:sugar phosphate nucleotidyltransferase [Candidatus Hydrogenedentota bacterium]HPG66027.1 sugar phosphate nucleotidyltransferase [Candidatus Hydrogenedentota bacterium]